MGKFVLNIELGDDAMQEPAHVAEALRELAERIDELEPDETDASGKVLDDNGNTVGEWTYENEGREGDDDDDG